MRPITEAAEETLDRMASLRDQLKARSQRMVDITKQNLGQGHRPSAG
jgi:hypothetical protein